MLTEFLSGIWRLSLVKLIYKQTITQNLSITVNKEPLLGEGPNKKYVVGKKNLKQMEGMIF